MTWRGSKLTAELDDPAQDEFLLRTEVPEERRTRQAARGGDLLHSRVFESPLGQEPERDIADLGTHRRARSLAQRRSRRFGAGGGVEVGHAPGIPD